jgi:hypothetical protein
MREFSCRGLAATVVSLTLVLTSPAFAHGGGSAGGGSAGGSSAGGSSAGGSSAGGGSTGGSSAGGGRSTGGGSTGGSSAGGSAGGGSAGASAGHGNGSNSQFESPDLTTCPKGAVWSRTRHNCLTQRSDIGDEELTDYAFALAKAARYQEALDTLDQLDNPQTPKALNYRGYATRKLGKTEEGIGYYLKSVALDPNYAEVREYLGEAYVIQGKVDLAKDQLQTIQKLCGNTTCEEYEELATAIKAAQPI